MKWSFLLATGLLALNCSKDSPSQVAIPFPLGTWSGTYMILYHTPNFSGYQKGTISMVFSDTTYRYSGIVDSSTYGGEKVKISGNGMYKKLVDSLHLEDISCSTCLDDPSSGIEGNFGYHLTNKTMILDQLRNDEEIQFTLTKQN